MGGCLTEVQLYQAFRREAPAGETQDALHHVLGCPLCHEQWKRFLLDEQVAEGIRLAVEGDARAGEETPGVAEALDLPDNLCIPGFRLRGDFIEGGQARVYRAVHEASQEEVAIKVFHNSPLNEGGHTRFSRELQSLARLRHPHVIPIRSAGEIRGHAYYVMPWIEGLPLGDAVARRPLSLTQRVDLLIKICSAVDHAHKRGVMHLDLKPSNVRVDRSGEPLVMDFGLARLSSADARDPADVGLGVAGTPAYMAPEQASDEEDVDTRADVFMLGLLLHETLSGTRARKDGDDGAQGAGLKLAQKSPPPLREVAPQVGRELAAIVARATALDREVRYQTAEALLDDLRRYRSGDPVRAMGAGLMYRVSKFGRRHLAVVVGVMAALLILASAMIVRRETQRMAAEAYGRATQVTRGLNLATQRQLGRAYLELARLYDRLGDGSKAEEYTVRAQTALRRAETMERHEGAYATTVRREGLLP